MKFVKFDVLYPAEYLKDQQQKNIESISKMDFDEYFEWLMGLRMGFNDLFSREAKKETGTR